MSLKQWPQSSIEATARRSSRVFIRHSVFALTLLLAIVAFAHSTLAYVSIFGPKTFARTPGKPEVFEENFTLSSLSGTFTLVVQNGDTSGKRRVNGEISLNGFTVLTQSELNTRTGHVEKIINASALRTTNVLSIKLKGGQGVGKDQPPFITVSIVRDIDDTDGPVITIDQPKPGEIFTNSPIEVSGTVTDTSGVATLKVNGNLTPVVNDAFSTQITLNPGGNQIIVTATDSIGNTSQKSVDVTLEVPRLVSVVPNSGQAGQNHQVEIKGEFTHFAQGTTQATFGAGIAVGGSPEGAVGPITVINPTTATAQITINAAAAVGPRTVSVQTGAEQVALVNAFNVTAPPPPPPSIISVTPNTGQVGQSIEITVAAQNTHFVQGTTQASFGAGIAVGGAAEGAFGPVTVNSPTSITAQLTLNSAAVPGPRTVSVRTGSEDVSLANGFTITGTGEAPTISITAPASGTFVFVKRPAIEVSYNAAAGIDFASLTFTANDQPLTTDCQLNNTGGRCASSSDLPEGAVTLAATIKDLDGKSGTGTVEFTVDSAPVQLSITMPAAGLITKEETVAVTGTFGAGVNSIKVNDVAATLTNNTFSAAVPLKEGVNMLVAVGTTANGKTGTNSVAVTRDTAAPLVRIDSPRDGFTSIANEVAVTGLVNDLVSGGIDAQVKVNGISATIANGAFVAMNLPLVRGPNTIEAIATDSVGNTDRHSIIVNFEVPVGARLTVLSGDAQKAVVKQLLPQPLVAVVKDDLGNPVAGRVVRFEVTRNSGTLQVNSGDAPLRVVQVPTDGSGRAAVLLTLGDTTGEGNNRVTATALGVAGEAGFCATALAAPANKILANMGDNQRGAAGQPLANRFEALVVDLDGNPLQGVSVTFTVVKGNGRLDGQENLARVTGNDGIARVVLTLGPDPGISNNVVNATFEGLTGLPATFTASGLAPGDPANTRFSGVVLDNGHTPIPGTLVTIEGTNLQATTDQNGQFLLTNVPVGHIHLHVDPTNSPRPETFPELAFVTVTVAGQNNILGQPILIPALDMENSKIVGGNQDVTLTMRGVPGLAMTIFANSAKCPGGAPTCRVTISQVHLDKVPMAPPNGTLFMPPAWTIQPHGVHFTVPARMTIPNNGLAPGRIIDMFQFDHDLNMFVNIGKGTVSQDGLTITTDPGFGITAAGWGGGGPPPPPTTCASSCDDKNPCTEDKCDNGSCVHTPVANGTACDDKQECTINDKCTAGRCKGEDVNISQITGSCVGPVNAGISLTAVSNAPERVNWTAPSGNPTSGKGGSFTVQYSSEGDKTVTASCKAASKTTTITIGPTCAGITPTLVEPEVAMAPQASDFGTTFHRTAQSAKYKGCVDGGKWCFRLEEYSETHGLGVHVSIPGLTDVNSATDPSITPATCVDVIASLTPPAGSGPPRTLYWSSSITRAHENFHVQDFSTRVSSPTMNDLASFVSNNSNCTNCKSSPPATFNMQMNTFWTNHRPMYFDGNSEVRAHNFSNGLYAALIQQIRQRARNAPAAEGWPAACK